MIKKKLAIEEDNADWFLQDSTRPKLVNIILSECIANVAKELTDKTTCE